MVGVAGLEVELLIDVRDVLDDRLLADQQFASDESVAASLGHESEDLHLAVSEPFQRPVLAARPGEHELDHLGVEDNVAGADALEVVAEGGNVGDPLLEQVAHSSAGTV